jgi:hypothetical protein
MKTYTISKDLRAIFKNRNRECPWWNEINYCFITRRTSQLWENTAYNVPLYKVGTAMKFPKEGKYLLAITLTGTTEHDTNDECVLINTNSERHVTFATDGEKIFKCKDQTDFQAAPLYLLEEIQAPTLMPLFKMFFSPKKAH